jgi:hypothetical protein
MSKLYGNVAHIKHYGLETAILNLPVTHGWGTYRSSGVTFYHTVNRDLNFSSAAELVTIFKLRGYGISRTKCSALSVETPKFRNILQSDPVITTSFYMTPLYHDRHSVLPISSSLSIVTLRSLVITTLVYNDTKYSVPFMTL